VEGQLLLLLLAIKRTRNHTN